mmetsp:Transcript_3494/g.10940  ORF Transcript_3494/g.10940 Transcript_3494/m.10940 type:complete len:340 (+) Transcript_3494:913-1932(+)
MDGTRPSMVTRARSTNRQKGRPVGAPQKSARVASLSSAAYTSHGPIIQPRLVGQHTTSRVRTSCRQCASAALRSGGSADQGMAFGSPVVPLEKRMPVMSPAPRITGSKRSPASSPAAATKSTHTTSPSRSATPSATVAASAPAAGSTTTRGAPSQAATRAYSGSSLPPRGTPSCVMASLASERRRRVAISGVAKLSAMETATMPAAMTPRKAITLSTFMGMSMATASPSRSPAAYSAAANPYTCLRSCAKVSARSGASGGSRSSCHTTALAASSRPSRQQAARLSLAPGSHSACATPPATSGGTRSTRSGGAAKRTPMRASSGGQKASGSRVDSAWKAV